MSSNESKNYDIIFIGSGLGTLACASIMAQLRGKRVLILERHYVVGGFTHEFDRRKDGTKYSWDVGIHYVGDMQAGGMLRRLFDIISRNSVKWNAMPRIFEKFVYPDFTFPVPSSEADYKAALQEKFPAEAKAIESYFIDINQTDTSFGRHNMKTGMPFVDQIKHPKPLHGFENSDITIGAYLDKNIGDRKLKALLLSQWGDYGIPPARASFIIHASVVRHYLKGGFYPEGGASSIAKSIQPIIENAGGEILLSHQVDEIIIENDTAVGVRARKLTARKDEPDGREYRAPVIISDAGAYITYNQLVPQSVPISFRDSLKDFYKKHPVTTSVTLYVALKEDPRKLGFQGENHWMFTSYDHDNIFANSSNWIMSDGDLKAAYLSFPSLKKPAAKGHTAEIIALVNYEPFLKWQNSDWKRRGEDYETVKSKITETLLKFIEDRYPGFREMIVFHELSTPLSVEHFTGHPGGSIYGVPCVRERFRSDMAPWCQTRTPIKGLYLTGADASSPGIAGALMGAMATVGQIPDGISFLRVLKEAANLGHPQKNPY